MRHGLRGRLGDRSEALPSTGRRQPTGWEKEAVVFWGEDRRRLFPYVHWGKLGAQTRRGYYAPLELGGSVTAEGGRKPSLRKMHLFGRQEAITSMRDAHTHRLASL